MSTYLLRLYITGNTGRSRQALQNLEAICADQLAGRYRLEVIDILEHPQRAEDEKILATPTLVKELPPPLRKLIGDLSDSEKVLDGLGLISNAPDTDKE